MILRIFGWSFGLTLLALVGAFVLGGPEAGVIVAILIVLEVSLSFDNAVINATSASRSRFSACGWSSRWSWSGSPPA